MKLRTKFQDEDFDLGEVVEGVIVECLGKYEEELRVVATAAKGGQHTFYYSSIKKFMDDWEDAPEEYWFVAGRGAVEHTLATGDENDPFDKGRREIGNYFATKEEAEKAVERLRAWKRLKDTITCIDRATFDDVGTATLFIRYEEEYHKKVQEYLDLLFGGEE